MIRPRDVKSCVVALAAVALVDACGGAGEPSSTANTFVANATSFRGFRDWTSRTFMSDVQTGSPHVGGNRTVYVNALPASGVKEFPVGTLIVKATETDTKLFARAKRGGDFNRIGAVGWEWFELEEDSAGLSIKWRGFGPPAGEMYGGDPNAGCNGCHKVVPAQDYVLTPWLMLASGADADADASDGVDASP